MIKKIAKSMGDSGTWGTLAQMNAPHKATQSVKKFHALKGKAPFSAPKKTLKGMMNRLIGR